MMVTSNIVGTSLKAASFNGNTSQNWEFIYQGEGYYLIRNRDNGYYMTSPSIAVNQAAITQEPLLLSALDQQLWKIKRNMNGVCRIQSKVRILDGNSLFLGLLGENIVETYVQGNVDWKLPYVNSSTTALEGQQMSKWCWATSARMFANHYCFVPSTRTQVTAVTAVKGGVVNCTGSNSEAIEAIGHYYSNNIDVNELNLVESMEAIFEEKTLLEFFDAGNVIYIVRGWYTQSNVWTGGHAYLAYGYTKEFINGNIEVRYLIRDPFPEIVPSPWDTPTITTGKTHLWSYETICNGRKTNVDTGIWVGYVVVSTDYSMNTILPVYN